MKKQKILDGKGTQADKLKSIQGLLKSTEPKLQALWSKRDKDSNELHDKKNKFINDIIAKKDKLANEHTGILNDLQVEIEKQLEVINKDIEVLMDKKFKIEYEYENKRLERMDQYRKDLLS